MTTFPCVDIINIGDDLEVIALRALLERWGVVVRVWHIAAASALVPLLNGNTTLSDIVVISCHGGKDGLHLPELAPEVAAEQPYDGTLTATQLREFTRLSSLLVVNTGCTLGCSDFASAFLDAGCNFYIGGNGYLDGDASLLYLSLFFYEHLCRHHSVEESHQKAASYDEETGLFQIFNHNTSTQ